MISAGSVRVVTTSLPLGPFDHLLFKGSLKTIGRVRRNYTRRPAAAVSTGSRGCKRWRYRVARVTWDVYYQSHARNVFLGSLWRILVSTARSLKFFIQAGLHAISKRNWPIASFYSFMVLRYVWWLFEVMCVSIGIASKNALFLLLLLLLLYGILKEWKYRKVYISGCWKVLYCQTIKLMEVNVEVGKAILNF